MCIRDRFNRVRRGSKGTGQIFFSWNLKNPYSPVSGRTPMPEMFRCCAPRVQSGAKGFQRNWSKKSIKIIFFSGFLGKPVITVSGGIQSLRISNRGVPRVQSGAKGFQSNWSNIKLKILRKKHVCNKSDHYHHILKIIYQQPCSIFLQLPKRYVRPSCKPVSYTHLTLPTKRIV